MRWIGRSRLTAWFAFVAACALLVRGPAPDARGDDDDFAVFAETSSTTESLLEALKSKADGMTTSPGAATSGPVTVVTQNDAAAGKTLADEIAGMLKRGADALTAAGFAAPASAEAPLVVVRVRARFAASLVLASEDGDKLFVRDGEAGHVVAPPTPPTRGDGFAIARDAVAASNRARVWAWTQSSPSQTTSLSSFAARRLVRDIAPAAAKSPWVADALVAWVEAQAAPDAAPRHSCRPWAAPTAESLAKLLAAGRPPLGARPFLVRFMGALLAGAHEPQKAVTTLAQTPAALDVAVPEAFGKKLVDVLAAAGPASARGAADPMACDETGTITCALCKGMGKIELTCQDCDGAGAVCCPSCLGSDTCPECTSGWIVYEGGKKVKCHVCTGGKTHCMACGGTLKAPCKSCNGTGRSTWPCPGRCNAGRLPCPASGAAQDATPPCPWCADAKLQSACPTCLGASYTGCRDCWGTLKVTCGKCGGSGETRMVYTDGTTASASKCAACDGKGYSKCDKCGGAGKLPCSSCGGKGRVPRDTAHCPLCDGTGKLAPPGWNLLRAKFTPFTKEELDAHKEMIDKAVKFVLTCDKTASGAFALRKQRKGRNDLPVQALEPPTLFSNAFCLWTLAIAGQPMDDPQFKRARDQLRTDAQAVVSGTAEYKGSQATALALRALVAMGESPTSPLVKSLVDKLVKGQHGDGFWGDTIDDPKEPGDALDTLFVAESLRLARMRGSKVFGVWTKLLRAATMHLDSHALSAKNDWLIGTDVASSIALVIMAKEGTLGSKATSFDYESIPCVKRGMAWLDRHFDVAHEPKFSRGARRADPTDDAGYMAWLFSIQRLGMLLSLEELGGERWYPTASRFLKSVQFADGDFEERSKHALNGPVRTTCGAILFLLRATPSITNGKDDE
jgi:hypothetical protein